MIDNHEIYLRDIGEAAQRVLENPEMNIFGSFLRGELVAASDIDVLIIAEIPKSHLKRAELIAKIEETAELPLVHPFHINIITHQEFETWKELYKFEYRKFLL